MLNQALQNADSTTVIIAAVILIAILGPFAVIALMDSSYQSGYKDATFDVECYSDAGGVIIETPDEKICFTKGAVLRRSNEPVPRVR